VEDLVESEAEERVGGGIDGSVSQDGQERVDSAKLAKNAVEQLHDESPVGWGRLVSFEQVVQDVV
jgi:hypothetical protein